MLGGGVTIPLRIGHRLLGFLAGLLGLGQSFLHLVQGLFGVGQPAAEFIQLRIDLESSP